MYIPTIVLLVIVLLVIESVFVHKTSIKLDILDQKMKLDIFVSYLSQRYQLNNEEKKDTCSCVNISRLSSRTISKYNV